MSAEELPLWLRPSRRPSPIGQHDAGSGHGEIKLAGASFGYGDDMVIDGAWLEVGRGELVCVVGPSGAGKTTLMRLLYGSLRPRRGVAVVDGVDLCRLRRRHVSRFRGRLGCVFQSL